jgi:hypothetical protein
MGNARRGFCWWVLAAAAAYASLPTRGVELVSTKPSLAFTDVTKEFGVAEAITRHYTVYPNWWLSGLNLVDLDGDGQLDLFFAAHGAGRSLAMLGDGHGHFTVAEGSCPPSEIHLPYDINEDGKLDLQMTWQDGGGRWWINESTPGRLSFRESDLTAGQPQKLLWFEQVLILNSQSAHNYYSYAQTERHFGLSQRRVVDVSVEFYPSGKRVERKAAHANSTLVLSEERTGKQ